MGRKTKRIKVITADELPEGWESHRSTSRTEIMPSRVHGAGKTERAKRRSRKMADKISVRDLHIERDYI